MAEIYHMYQASGLQASLHEAIAHALAQGDEEVAESLRRILDSTGAFGGETWPSALAN